MITENINSNNESGAFIVRLDEIKDISLLTPVYFEFKKNKKYISTWKTLYIEVVKILAKEYYTKIASWAGMGEIYRTGMVMPEKSCSYIEGALYLNTDILDNAITPKIIKFMHICDENERLLKLCCKISQESNFNNSDKHVSIFEDIKNKCQKQINKLTDEVKSILEINDHDEAISKFSECHLSVLNIKNSINNLCFIEEKFKQNSSILTDFTGNDSNDINSLIENMISEEKDKALITLEMDDWTEAEKTFNNSRENIRLLRSAMNLLKELEYKNEQSDFEI